MAGRTETDPSLNYAQGNTTTPSFEAPRNGNLPERIYKLAWLDNSLYNENQYVVCQKLAPGNSIVRLWDSSREQLPNYEEIGPGGRRQYTIKFLVAAKNGVVPRPQESQHAIHRKAIYVDSDMIPNIYAGRLKTVDSELIGTIKKVITENGSKIDRFAFFTQSPTGEPIKSESKTFEVFCYG